MQCINSKLRVHIHCYQETLHEKTGITPMEVKKGGSLGQGTAVNGEFDLDLVIITEGIAITSVPEARVIALNKIKNPAMSKI